MKTHKYILGMLVPIGGIQRQAYHFQNLAMHYAEFPRFTLQMREYHYNSWRAKNAYAEARHAMGVTEDDQNY